MDYAVLHGQVTGPRDLGALQAALSSFDGALRESTHYQDGAYLCLSSDANGIVQFERVGLGEFLAHGDADSAQDLIDLLRPVSNRLAERRIRHRFEIYEGEALQQYFHHDWPANSRKA